MYPLDEWQRTTMHGSTARAVLDYRRVFCASASSSAWIAATAGETVVAVRRRMRVTLSACALVLLPLAISAVRNVGLFLMVAVPAITALCSRREAHPRGEARAAVR